jgi:hypothetical protein
MNKQRFRFISLSFRIVSFILILLPAIGTSFIAWKWCKEYTFQQVEQQQKEISTSILDMARSRYDLTQNYMYYSEQALRNNLTTTADILHRTARELELETARRNLPLHRAQTVFLNIVSDMSQMKSHNVSVFSDTGKIVYSSLLPEGFDMSEHPWVQTMLEDDRGEFQFSWRYPGEADSAERIMVYRLIHGWKWIVSAEDLITTPLIESYTDRQYQGLTDYIAGYHAPAGGFVMIIDANNRDVIAHPELQTESNEKIPGISKIVNARRGSIVYQDEAGNNYRAHVEIFLPFRWVIAVTAQDDQILYQARGIRRKLIATTLILGVLIMILFYRLQRAILYRSISQRRYSDIEIQ